MHYTITRASVHQHAYELLQSCLRARDFGCCTARVTWHVVFAACARLCTLAAACRLASFSRFSSEEGTSAGSFLSISLASSGQPCSLRSFNFG